MARDDPVKFYEKVVSEKINQFKAEDDGYHHKINITHKVTQRKIGRILLLVKNHLVEFFKNKWTPAQLKAAFED